MSEFMLGIVLVVIAGVCEGLFSMGVTRTPKWKFENIWGLGSLIALVLVPWPLAFLTIPKLGSVYAAVGPGLVVVTLLFGIGWGLGGIFWGKAIAAVGMALGVSLLMGFINVFGSLGPMAIREPATLMTPGGLTLMGAVAVMIIGVVTISRAGQLKERELSAGAGEATGLSTPFIVGLTFCVVSGVLSALVNFGFIYGAPMATAAAENGASAWATGFGIWALVFTGNYAVNFIYALSLMVKNKTGGLILSEGTPMYWFWAIFMGITWPGGIALFGMAAQKMGDYGAYVAFPMMILCSILAGNAAGAVTGEWKGTSGKPRGVMTLGVLVLFAAFVILGLANKILSSG